MLNDGWRKTQKRNDSEHEIFKTSKRTPTTPNKTQTEKSNEILALMKEMNQSHYVINKEQKEIKPKY